MYLKYLFIASSIFEYYKFSNTIAILPIECNLILLCVFRTDYCFNLNAKFLKTSPNI